jgi:hypothetical protein
MLKDHYCDQYVEYTMMRDHIVIIMLNTGCYGTTLCSIYYVKGPYCVYFAEALCSIYYVKRPYCVYFAEDIMFRDHTVIIMLNILR